MKVKGKIINIVSNIFYVEVENKIYECTSRGIFKAKDEKPVVGDDVLIEVENDTGNILEIVDRKKYIKRPKMANLTQLILVVSSKNPVPDLLMLDKQLVFAEFLDVKPIIVINKIDLENKLNKEIENSIKISIKNNTGIEEIKKRITEIFNLDKISTNDMSYLSNARSISLLKQSLNKLNECLNNIKANTPIDIIELDLKECWSTLGEIIGETYTDELIDEMFSRFCLGK